MCAVALVIPFYTHHQQLRMMCTNSWLKTTLAVKGHPTFSGPAHCPKTIHYQLYIYCPLIFVHYNLPNCKSHFFRSLSTLFGNFENESKKEKGINPPVAMTMTPVHVDVAVVSCTCGINIISLSSIMPLDSQTHRARLFKFQNCLCSSINKIPSSTITRCLVCSQTPHMVCVRYQGCCNYVPYCLEEPHGRLFSFEVFFFFFFFF